eukprot:comp21049_c0_seq3/m.44242 comp21049_c0_seq3/g.44242  ORF comp21049_c0_seq3/g.44242 comp21049_c0_seq3/m.44242 type:complete len:106 (-) comp21049_c0_seq3:683-1000(-)
MDHKKRKKEIIDEIIKMSGKNIPILHLKKVFGQMPNYSDFGVSSLKSFIETVAAHAQTPASASTSTAPAKAEAKASKDVVSVVQYSDTVTTLEHRITISSFIIRL